MQTHDQNHTNYTCQSQLLLVCDNYELKQSQHINVTTNVMSQRHMSPCIITNANSIKYETCISYMQIHMYV